jgi:hypothetical protein
MELMHNDDCQYLNLLSFFNYVLGGIHLSLLIVSLSYFFQAWRFASLYDSEQVRYASPVSLSGLLLSYGLIIFLVGLAYALMTLASGRCLKRRKGYGFSFTVACLQCISIPFGTILGIVTINILLKDSVRVLYQSHQR